VITAAPKTAPKVAPKVAPKAAPKKAAPVNPGLAALRACIAQTGQTAAQCRAQATAGLAN
jgi:hypothetical protein